MFRLAVLLALLQAGATQVPPRDRAAVQKPGTASIRGRVTDLETGQPIARAVVTLSSSQPPLSMETASDADGRYAFAELAAGEYATSVAQQQLEQVELLEWQRHGPSVDAHRVPLDVHPDRPGLYGAADQIVGVHSAA